MMSTTKPATAVQKAPEIQVNRIANSTSASDFERASGHWPARMMSIRLRGESPRVHSVKAEEQRAPQQRLRRCETGAVASSWGP